ncbi:MAG TPA: pantoate--beta-alanine ligase [Pyrinomonadaceae bacterium]|jgi:pantoate--beta-alanine ligase|nr:pantoate--beta-alanine ligase [Pyrinomonadaceae bacterium]
MRIITSRDQMISIAREVQRDGRIIGFVPTMGALHAGHLSLMRAARAQCDTLVVSIFVNPTQFGPAEDFEKYPRDLQKDAALLTGESVDYLFAPTVNDIYPPGSSTFITVEGLSEQLEGASRQGHFRGVATVVAILLNIVRPDIAFFGQKDAQQAAVLKRMVHDLAFDTKVVVLPIVREESGLALSSRNAYLSEEEKRAATVLHRGLSLARSAYENSERDGTRLLELVRSTIAAEPLARVDYISLNDAETLEPLEHIADRPALLSLAVYLGKTRLIDNLVLGQTEKQDAASA